MSTSQQNASPLTYDFRQDFRNYLSAELQLRGFSVAPSADLLGVVLAWLNFEHNQIKVKPRSVAWSNELRNAALPTEQREGLARIESASIAGQDLNPFLSTRIGKVDHRDGMLLDWGIWHMHLGEILPGKSFAERTGPLLFVKITDATLYVLTIQDHASKPFANQEVLEVLHRNWPQTLAPYRLDGVVGFETAYANMTPDERHDLRGAHATMGVQMSDGTFYMAPGGGVTATGGSAIALDRADRLIAKVRTLETQVKKHESDILAHICSSVEKPPSMCRLQFQAQRIAIVEVNTGLEIPLALIGVRLSQEAVGAG